MGEMVVEWTDEGLPVVNGDIIRPCFACNSELMTAREVDETWFRTVHEWGCWRMHEAGEAHTREEIRIRTDFYFNQRQHLPPDEWENDPKKPLLPARGLYGRLGEAVTQPRGVDMATGLGDGVPDEGCTSHGRRSRWYARLWRWL